MRACLTARPARAMAGVALVVTLLVLLPGPAARASSWATESSGTSNNLYAVSCSDANNCWAVGGTSSASTILHTASNSSAAPSWTAQTVSIAKDLDAVSCPSSSLCVATGSALGAVPKIAGYNGSSWSSKTVPGAVSSSASLQAVSCVPATTDCAAVSTLGSASNPVVIDTTSAPSGWSGESLTNATYGLYGISCPSTSLCVAVGGSGTSADEILYSTNPFSASPTWSVPTTLPAGTQLMGVSCAAGTTQCVAVGDTNGTVADILTSTTGTTTWTTRTSGAPNENLLAVQCESASACWAGGAGGTLIATTNGGTSWSTQTSSTTNQIEGIDVENLAFGKAVGDSGAIIGYTGCNTGGTLNLSPPSSLSWPSTTLTGANQTATATLSLSPDDETGSGAGWNLTATSTTFTAGTRTLPTTAATITAATAAAASGNCTAPSGNAITYPVTVPAGATAPTAVKVFDTAAATGAGPSTVNLTAALRIPGNALTGTYTSTWTVTLASGP